MRLTISLVLLLIPLAGGAWCQDLSTCVSCHGTLSREYAGPVKVWEGDIHRQAGMECTDCHGGDPQSLPSAMDPQRGFLGAPRGEAAVRLCGGCHEDPDRVADPTLSTGQERDYRAGGHDIRGGKDRPTCVTCHGSHGIVRVTDPSSTVFPTRVAGLCLPCHRMEEPLGRTPPERYLGDVHGQSLSQAGSSRAPTCADCHGAHRTRALSTESSHLVCGNCHTREYSYFQRGPHGRALDRLGEPSCTYCHGYHGIKATGIEEIVGKVTDTCWKCHDVRSNAWEVGRKIDESLGRSLGFLDSLRSASVRFRRSGVETGDMDLLIQDAYRRLVEVESAIHSVNADWEELTGLAKVKMMAAWDLSRDYSLEKGLRRVTFLLVALLALSIVALLAYKLNLIEKDQRRRHVLGSPEARQKEQEHRRK